MSPTPFYTSYCNQHTHPLRAEGEKRVPPDVDGSFATGDTRFFTDAELLSISISVDSRVENDTKPLPHFRTHPLKDNSASESAPTAPAAISGVWACPYCESENCGDPGLLDFKCSFCWVVSHWTEIDWAYTPAAVTAPVFEDKAEYRGFTIHTWLIEGYGCVGEVRDAGNNIMPRWMNTDKPVEFISDAVDFMIARVDEYLAAVTASEVGNA